MTVPVVIGIGLLGGAGAVARAGLAAAVSARVGRGLPLGIFVVNVLGSLLLGVCVGAALGADAYRLTATGFVGAFTTFSTWVYDTHRLGERGRAGAAAANVVVSLLAGVGAAWLGRRFGAGL